MLDGSQDGRAMARYQLADELAYERARFEEELETAAARERARADRVIRETGQYADMLSTASGVVFTLAAAALYGQRIGAAVWFLAVGMIARAAAREARKGWRSWHEWGREDG